MTTTTITTTDYSSYSDATRNIISALSKYTQLSIKMTGKSDGWVPLYWLGLYGDEIDIAAEVNIINVDDRMVRFIETDVDSICNLLW